MLVQTFLKKKFKTFSRSLLFAAFFFASILTTKNSYADLDYGVGRIRTCNATTGDVETLDFNPTSGGKDVLFDMSNPVCITVVATSYAITKGAIAAMNWKCGTGSKVPRLTPSPILDAKDLIRAGKAARTDNVCLGFVGAAAASLSASLIELGSIYGAASRTFANSRICGSDWVMPDPKNQTNSLPYHKQVVKLAVEKYAREDVSKLSLAANDTAYNEWYYGGIEVEDNPSEGNACEDVTKKAEAPYPKQKYYLKGVESGNYNCKKYDLHNGENDPLTNAALSEDRALKFKEAYNCCISRSREYVCVEFKEGGTPKRKFCRAGTKCNIVSYGLNITFTAKSLDEGRLICAETYSLCPYNFSIGGGTEYCDYYQDGKWNGGDKWSEGYWTMITQADIVDGLKNQTCNLKSDIRNANCTYNDLAGKCRNYCQYLRHCTKSSEPSFKYISNISSPYFAMACLNFIGDSQNKTALGGGFILGSQKHFSAPIAQCIKETLENVFYNRAGHSDCANYKEQQSADGLCSSDTYVTDEDSGLPHKKGGKVKKVSFFTTIQDAMQNLVKMVLTLSVMFYGMNVLIGKNDIRQKKDILVYIVKIALVLYFATGNAWQGMFFEGVYGASSELSRMVFKIQVNDQDAYRDGCQFGDLTDKDGITTEAAIDKRYPPGKGYLAMWDTLDCKIARYLGFGPEVSAANIASLILAGFLTGPIGIYFAISVMFFGFFFIVATIRALHIFLSSCISIIIFVFISPIIIPTLLFEKTKNIFSGWLSNLIGFCLQPMLLFAYIAIFVMVLDKTVIGSATFSGAPPSRTISCSKTCINSDGTVDPYVDGNKPACNKPGQTEVDPMLDSVACLIGIDSFGKFPGLEVIGLSIPILINIFDHNAKEKVLTLVKAALVMFLLCKFMDEIPGMTSTLIGSGSSPTAPGADSKEMFKAFGKAARTAQKRAIGATKKIGGAAGRAGRAGADAARKMMSRGKGAEADSGGSAAGDHSGTSGGGADSSGSTGGDGAGTLTGSTGGDADSSGSSPSP